MDTESDLIAELPLFPLQSVLFPGGWLPLRIFEVRYLDMIGRRHREGAPFGVVCLTRGSEVRRREPPAGGRPSGEAFADEAFFELGTLAEITQLERPQPGLMMIRCTGTQRFRIRRSERLRHGLWVADVERLPADATVAVPDDLAFTRSGLQQVQQNLLRQGLEDGDTPWPDPPRWNDCGWLANRWVELLPLAADDKQRLMALDNPLLRLELVADALGRFGIGPPADG